MKKAQMLRLFLLFFAAMLPGSGWRVLAQAGGSMSGQSKPAGGADRSPLGTDTGTETAPSKETQAFQSFQAIPDAQAAKKEKAGEDFIRKFPNSVYLEGVYSILSLTYIEAGQADKGFADGEKALALKPNDVRLLGNLAQSMARLNNPSDPDAEQKLQKAEQYAKKCIEVTSALTKPEGVSEQDFTTARDQTLALAHSALGTVALRRGKFAEAIPDLQQATQLDATKDATNYYLLGVANQNSGHYSEAAEAFNKCATGGAANLQQPCRDGAAQAQKLVAK